VHFVPASLQNSCLHSWSDDEWDQKMKRDLASGKLDKILARVDEDIAKNRIHPAAT
jgi:hypothetical protein